MDQFWMKTILIEKGSYLLTELRLGKVPIPMEADMSREIMATSVQISHMF